MFILIYFSGQFNHERQNVTVISWSHRSPDLNPIEIMWAIVKQKLEIENVKNLAKLNGKVLDNWEEFNMDLVKCLIRHMSDFIKKCIMAKGAIANK